MARSATTNQQLRDARREQILAAATRLFATKGLAATRIQDIAREVGMAPGLVYHYFESKEAVYDEIVGHAMTRLVAASEALAALPGTPREKIHAALERLVREIGASQTVAETFLLTSQVGFSSTPASTRRRHQALRRRPYEIVADILRAGQQDGSVRAFDADQMATVFWTTIKGLALHRVTFGRDAVMPAPDILMATFFVERRSR